MSYDISLCDPVTHAVIEINDPHFMRGGTYQVGGSTELWLNITYNYARYYYESTKEDTGIRGIYGKTGLESIPILNDMIEHIKNRYQDENGNWVESEGETSNYWDETASNAIKPLYQLIAFAKMRPDGIWEGD